MKFSFIDSLNDFIKEPSCNEKYLLFEYLIKDLKAFLSAKSILIHFSETNSIFILSRWFKNSKIEFLLKQDILNENENEKEEFNNEFNLIKEKFISKIRLNGELLNEEFIFHDKKRKIIIISTSEIEKDKIEINEKKVILKSIFTTIFERNDTSTELKLINTIVNSLNEGICSLDVEGNVIWINDTFEKITGYERKELLGKPGLLFHHPVDHPRLKDTLRKRADGSESHSSYHMNILRKDGSIKDVFVSGSVLKSKKDESLGSSGIFMDITDYTRLEDEVKDTKDFLETILETMSEGVMTFKIDGQIQYINLASRTILGFESKSINEPNSFFEIIASPNDYNEEFFYKLLKKLLHQEKEIIILRMKKTDGTIIPVQVTFTIAIDVVKEVKFIIAILKDLSKGFELIEQVKKYRRYLFQNSNVTLSIVRFGRTGTEIVYTDPLYFTNNNAVLLQSAAIYLSALGQTKLEDGVQTWSKGTFGPLPVPKYSTESLMTYFGSMASDERSDDRFSANQQKEPFLILFIFPKTSETIFHREEVDKAIKETLKEINITSFIEFSQKKFVEELKERIIQSEVGIKSLVNQDPFINMLE